MINEELIEVLRNGYEMPDADGMYWVCPNHAMQEAADVIERLMTSKHTYKRRNQRYKKKLKKRNVEIERLRAEVERVKQTLIETVERETTLSKRANHLLLKLDTIKVERDVAVAEIEHRCDNCKHDFQQMCGIEPCSYCENAEKCAEMQEFCRHCASGKSERWEWRGVGNN